MIFVTRDERREFAVRIVRRPQSIAGSQPQRRRAGRAANWAPHPGELVVAAILPEEEAALFGDAGKVDPAIVVEIGGDERHRTLAEDQEQRWSAAGKGEVDRRPRPGLEGRRIE